MRLLSRVQATRSLLADPTRAPFLRGRLAQLAGMALVADGIVGLERPLDRRNTRPGLFGAVFIMLLGCIFLGAGAYFLSLTKPLEGGVSTQGSVVSVDVRTSTDSDGDTSTTCTPRVSYRVEEVRYEVDTPYSSGGLCDVRQGDAVEVSYLPAAPDEGRPLFPGESGFLWVFVLTGAAVAFWGLVTFLVRLASILGGLWLFLWGRREAREHPPVSTSSLGSDLATAWGLPAHLAGPLAAAAADPSPRALAAALRAGVSASRGASAPRRTFERLNLTPDLAASSAPRTAPEAPPSLPAPPLPAQRPAGGAPAAPALPPAWYPDPDGNGVRWWDGEHWSLHERSG